MTTIWDFSATWLFSVAPQFVQALSVFFSLVHVYLLAVVFIVWVWSVIDVVFGILILPKKISRLNLSCFGHFLCPSEAKMSFANSQFLFFLPTLGPTGLNLSSSLPFGRFRPLTTSFLKYRSILRVFSINFDDFRYFSVALDYSWLLSITLDYSRLLSITPLDCSRLLSITLAYSRLLSRLLSIIFWSMSSPLFDGFLIIFRLWCFCFSVMQHFLWRKALQRESRVPNTALRTSKMSKSHPLSLFSVASQHLTVVLLFFSATVCVFSQPSKGIRPNSRKWSDERADYATYRYMASKFFLFFLYFRGDFFFLRRRIPPKYLRIPQMRLKPTQDSLKSHKFASGMG